MPNNQEATGPLPSLAKKPKASSSVEGWSPELLQANQHVLELRAQLQREREQKPQPKSRPARAPEMLEVSPPLPTPPVTLPVPQTTLEAPPPSCVACQDKGHIGPLWEEHYCTCSAGVELAARKAAEEEERRREWERIEEEWKAEQQCLLLESLPVDYRPWDFDTYPAQANQKAKEQVLRFKEEWDGMQNLGIIGGVGIGKTSLIVSLFKAVALDLIEYPEVGAAAFQFVRAADLLAELRATFDEQYRRRGEYYVAVFQRYTRARLLVLDDLGADRPTEWGVDRLLDVVSFRKENHLPTFYTSNWKPAELEQIISERAYSRLVYSGELIAMTGTDLRKLFWKGVR